MHINPGPDNYNVFAIDLNTKMINTNLTFITLDFGGLGGWRAEVTTAPVDAHDRRGLADKKKN